jgi:hypothetical protein
MTVRGFMPRCSQCALVYSLGSSLSKSCVYVISPTAWGVTGITSFPANFNVRLLADPALVRGFNVLFFITITQSC